MTADEYTADLILTGFDADPVMSLDIARKHCAALTTAAGVNHYRVGLSERGALTSDAMAAIRDRQDALLRGKA